MSNIKIKPHVGRRYGDPCNIFKGKKILALGESVYINEEDFQKGGFEKLTEQLVEEYLHFRKENKFNDEKYIGGWTNTYLKFERALVGRTTQPEGSRKIWESIVFYNYLQTPITEGARTSGTDKAYAESQKAFIEVVKQHKPDIIIVWGVGILYDALPPTTGDFEWKNEDAIDAEGYKVHNGKYSWMEGENEVFAKVVAIYHPSSGFSWSWWHDKVLAREEWLNNQTKSKHPYKIPKSQEEVEKKITELTKDIASKEEELNVLLQYRKTLNIKQK